MCIALIPLKIAAKMWEPAERAYFRAQATPRLDRNVEEVAAELVETISRSQPDINTEPAP